MVRFQQLKIRTQRGVALAIVVWFLAAMSLLVSGIVFQARVDTRMAQVHVVRAKAAAAGDGAIQLMLAAATSGGRAGGGLASESFVIGDLAVSVHMVPAAGLINLNTADREILKLLFSTAAGTSPEQAQLLAGNVIKWRQSSVGSKGQSKSTQFAAIEDLLRVEGISRTLLDDIRDYVAVGSGAGQLDWAAAPQPVLDLLAGKDAKKALSISRGRAEQSSSNKKNRAPSGGTFRIDALVEAGDRVLLRRRWVSLAAAQNSRLPWRFSRTEPARVFSVL